MSHLELSPDFISKSSRIRGLALSGILGKYSIF